MANPEDVLGDFEPKEVCVSVNALPEAAQFTFEDGTKVTLTRKQISLLDTCCNILLQVGWTSRLLVDTINFDLPYSKIAQIQAQYKQQRGDQGH